MANLFGIFDDDKAKNKDINAGKKCENTDGAKLHLRKEELDIAKDRIQTGEVELSKEIVEEQKAVDVPVTHEEVIIERRAINNEPSDLPIGDEECIHIPVSEERVEVGKHTVVTGEISAQKRDVEETKEVKETLKREEARIDKRGDAKIVSNETDKNLH